MNKLENTLASVSLRIFEISLEDSLSLVLRRTIILRPKSSSSVDLTYIFQNNGKSNIIMDLLSFLEIGIETKSPLLCKSKVQERIFSVSTILRWYMLGGRLSITLRGAKALTAFLKYLGEEIGNSGFL
ncbi:hypothetical protein ES708_18356 [subsurface metagenome]